MMEKNNWVPSSLINIYDVLAECIIKTVVKENKISLPSSLGYKLISDLSEFFEKDLVEYLEYVKESELIPNTCLLARIFDMHIEKMSRCDSNFPVCIPEEMDDE